MLNVVKKDGNVESFNPEKILLAVGKASFRCDKQLTKTSEELLLEHIKNKLSNRTEVSVLELHEIVIASLRAIGLETVSKAYAEYRYYKNNYAKTFEQLQQDADDVLHLGDRENANFDSSLVSTKGSLIKGYLTKSLYKQFYLSAKEKEYIERGDIYIHDLRDMILGSVNCCLFDMAKVLKDGFEMSNVKYTEPKSVLSALQVIGDITLVASAQQFGGFTIPEIDKTLLPYCKKTFDTYYTLYAHELFLPINQSMELAMKAVERELEQGFQSLELKLNTVPCSRGDFAFTTLSFGQWHLNQYTEQELDILCLIGKVILRVREKGHGGKQVVFPKLVYLYDKKQIEKNQQSKALFCCAVKTSSKCMYPDYLSLSSEYGSVSRLFKETGVVTSPMGCRAYLTPWYDNGRAIAIGRCNIGAVSLNIPVIMEVCKDKYGDDWREMFYVELEDRMQVIRSFLLKRFDIIRHQKCSSNPLAFTQGGFYHGTKKPDDEVGDLVDYMTASFGITALDEATYLWNGERISTDDSNFALDVLKFCNGLIAKFKHEDGYMYALYGTPAESLCHTQAKQYAKLCADLGVENPFANHDYFSLEYFTNSFHANVKEEITPFTKQNIEQELFHNCEGGHIQYVRLDNPENFDAVKAIIERGMEKGFYQGVNFDAAYCSDCGQHSTNVLFECPHCGSKNISVISRVCGYLGYSNVNGSTRMNDGKMAEIYNRKSM